MERRIRSMGEGGLGVWGRMIRNMGKKDRK